MKRFPRARWMYQLSLLPIPQSGNSLQRQDYLKCVANMQNELYMIKSSAIEKEAAQEDIDQLNQCLQILEDILDVLCSNQAIARWRSPHDF